MSKTLSERAASIEAEAKAVAELSIFNQPSAIKQMLPDITGLIKQLCETVDQQALQIKKLTGVTDATANAAT